MRVLRGTGASKTLGFILPPRTGSRSIDHAISPLGVARIGGRHSVPSPLPEVDCMISNIRNPFDVLASWYVSQGPPHGGVGEDFGHFLDRVLDGGHTWIQDGTTLPGAKFAHRVIRFEAGPGEALNFLLREFGWPVVSVPHIGKSYERKSYRDYYNPVQRAAVRKAFADDFTRFGYEW